MLLLQRKQRLLVPAALLLLLLLLLTQRTESVAKAVSQRGRPLQLVPGRMFPSLLQQLQLLLQTGRLRAHPGVQAVMLLLLQLMLWLRLMLWRRILPPGLLQQL